MFVYTHRHTISVCFDHSFVSLPVFLFFFYSTFFSLAGILSLFFAVTCSFLFRRYLYLHFSACGGSHAVKPPRGVYNKTCIVLCCTCVSDSVIGLVPRNLPHTWSMRLASSFRLPTSSSSTRVCVVGAWMRKKGVYANRNAIKRG